MRVRRHRDLVGASKLEAPNHLYILPKHLGARAMQSTCPMYHWLSKNTGNLGGTSNQFYPFQVLGLASTSTQCTQFEERSIDQVPVLAANCVLRLEPRNILPSDERRSRSERLAEAHPISTHHAPEHLQKVLMTVRSGQGNETKQRTASFTFRNTKKVIEIGVDRAIGCF